MGKSNGPAGPNASKSERNPQRIVLLAGDERSEVKSVLAEYTGSDLQPVNVNEEVPKFAAEHAGKYVAIEWNDGLGWRRFSWCRRVKLISCGAEWQKGRAGGVSFVAAMNPPMAPAASQGWTPCPAPKH